MPASTLTRRLFMFAEVLAFALAVAVAALTSRARRLDTADAGGAAIGLALLGQRLTVEIRGQRLTAAFVAWVLAMSLLGPAPAALFGIADHGASPRRRGACR